MLVQQARHNARDMRRGKAIAAGHDVFSVEPANALFIATRHAFDVLILAIVKSVSVINRTPRHPKHFGKHRRVTLAPVIALGRHENYARLDRLATHGLKGSLKRHIRCAQAQIHDIHRVVHAPLNRRDQRPAIRHQRVVKNPHAIQRRVRCLLPNNPGTCRAVPRTIDIII